MKKVVAMALVGGRGSRLGDITKHTAKPAVSFGGKYRLIDFVLSNLIHSNIDTIGLLTQYEPHQLTKYIGNGSTWDLDVNEGGISFLTPYTSKSGEQWQKGTAHAIKQHMYFVDQYNAEHVLILSGDHIYKMDYQNIINTHTKSNADITIGSFNAKNDASRFGILEVDKQSKVIGFEEKPEFPKSKKASMGVYVFKTTVLKQLLEHSEQLLDFGKDIIPFALTHEYKIYTHLFKGYFKDVGTINSLFKANMDLIDNPQFLKLHEYKDFPIYTKSSNLPPHHITHHGSVTKSLVSDGCLVEGKLLYSILSGGCYIKKNSTLTNVILYNNVRVEDNVHLKNCIVLENTTIPKNTTLSFKDITVIDDDYLRGDFNE